MKYIKLLLFFVPLHFLSFYTFAYCCDIPKTEDFKLYSKYVLQTSQYNELCLEDIDVDIIKRMETNNTKDYETLYIQFHKLNPEINSELFADFMTEKFFDKTNDYIFLLSCDDFVELLAGGIEISFITIKKDKEQIISLLTNMSKKYQLTLSEQKGLNKLIQLVNSIKIQHNYVIDSLDGYVNYRKLPNRNSPIIKVIKNGVLIPAQSVIKQGNWYKVILSEQGNTYEGYIYKSGIKKLENS